MLVARVGTRSPRRWAAHAVLGPALVCLLVTVACSSSGDERDLGDDGGASGTPGTTLVGVTGTVPVADLPALPGGVATPTSSVVLAPVEPQASASGTDAASDRSAERLNGCAAAGSCREVDATLVVWHGASLAGMDLGFATLSGADLSGADLSGADLTGADLSGAVLAGAKFDGAQMGGADLSGASLTGASLRGADMRGVDLHDAIIDGASFQSALFCQTTWVDGTELNDMC